MRKIEVPLEVRQRGEDAVRHYVRMIREGQTERWALMCAMQVPPGTKGTDRAFQEGRLDGSWLDKMPAHQAQRIVREAKAAGIDITGKQYISGLADKRGHMDPMAWVSDTADVKKVAKAKNLNVQGIVNHQAVEMPPAPKISLNPRIARRLAAEEMARNPGLKRQEAIERIKERHLPSWKKRGK